MRRSHKPTHRILWRSAILTSANPTVENAEGNTFFIAGQKRPVTIYRFVCRGTIEERILELHTRKRDLADGLLEGTELTGKLIAEELMRLISL